MKLNYTTKDIVTIAVIAVIGGLIGAGWGYVWNLAFAVPVYGGALSGLITFVWFIPPMVTFYLIRKPGVALFTQWLAGIIGVLAGHPAGAVALGWWAIEGIGAEVGFAIFGYKRTDMVAMMVAGLLQAFNYAWSLVFFQIYNFGVAAWLVPWIATFATAWVAGPIGLAIGRALGRTGLYVVETKSQS